MTPRFLPLLFAAAWVLGCSLELDFNATTKPVVDLCWPAERVSYSEWSRSPADETVQGWGDLSCRLSVGKEIGVPCESFDFEKHPEWCAVAYELVIGPYVPPTEQVP